MNNELLDNRIIILNGEVNNESAMDVVKKLLYLDSLNHDDISLYINSPGGSVIDGLAIIDCMDYIKSDVATLCIGSSYSMGSVILSSGTKGKRYALPNSEIMIHDIKGGTYGDTMDVYIDTKRMERHHNKLVELLKKNTSQSKKKVEDALKKDYFMVPEDALSFGIIDKIIKKRK